MKDQSAPFDHPELYVPVGEKTNTDGSVMTSGGQAVDCFRQVPATGTAGGAPLVRFPNFSGPPCDDAPDVHNPPAVPRPKSATPVATAAPAAAPGAPAGSVAGSAVHSPAKCIVPKLRGRTVAKAKLMLAGSRCKLGLVLKTKRAKGRLVISSQRPSAGAQRPAGTRVAVRVRANSKR